MVRYYAASLALFACVPYAQAQTTPAENRPVTQKHPNPPSAPGMPLTLQQALTLAGVSSPVKDIADAELRSAQAARQVAGLRPNPSLQLEAENVAGTGLYRNTRQLESSANLSLPLEMGNKRSARIAVADARSSRAGIESAMLMADLRLTITLAYAEAAAAQRHQVIAQEQARIAAEMQRAATIRVQAGRASPLEVQRADVVHINTLAEVERASRNTDVARKALSAYIGQQVDGPIDQGWFHAISPFSGPIEPVDSADTLAYAAAQADLSIADASVRLARSQRVPDVTISAGARRFQETGDTAALFSLSVPLPVMDSGKAALSQARADQMGAQARQRLAAQSVTQAITRAEADAANAATSAQAATGPALSAAEEAARIARIGYREGKFSQLDLLEAERTLSDVRRASVDALLSYHSAEAQLARLTARAPSEQE